MPFPAVPQKPRRRNAAPEAMLQKAVLAYLAAALPPQAGVFYSANLNGVFLPGSRAKARVKEMGVRPGLPDLCFIFLTGERIGETYWIELKAPNGRPTAEQKVIVDALWAGGRGCYARSVEQVCAALVAWGFPVRARV